MSALLELQVPDIGEFKDVAVIEVLVVEGETISNGQNLIVVETDKATMEIPAALDGVIRKLNVAVGSLVSTGSVIGTVEPLDEARADASTESAIIHSKTPDSLSNAPAKESAEPPVVPASTPPDPVPTSPPENGAPNAAPHASPSVRKFARELGVSLAQVRGNGRGGRITAEDLRLHVKEAMQGNENSQRLQNSNCVLMAGMPAWPKIDFSKVGDIERAERPRIRKISGAVLHRNWVSIPHVTNHEDADITELEAFRLQLNTENEKSGPKFTLLAFIIKACVSALKVFPDFNASLDDEQVILKKYYHIGFAADTPNGVVVPVIRDADQKGLSQLARESATLAAKAREGKLAPADISGGSFSISSLGGIGGTYFTPIINAPEVAILGVGKSRLRVEWIEGRAAPRLILPLSLSWDHRVVDGAAAGRFNAHLARVLSDYRRAAL